MHVSRLAFWCAAALVTVTTAIPTPQDPAPASGDASPPSAPGDPAPPPPPPPPSIPADPPANASSPDPGPPPAADNSTAPANSTEPAAPPPPPPAPDNSTAPANDTTPSPQPAPGGDNRTSSDNSALKPDAVPDPNGEANADSVQFGTQDRGDISSSDALHFLSLLQYAFLDRINPDTGEDKLKGESFVFTDDRFSFYISTGSPTYTSWGMISQAMRDMVTQSSSIATDQSTPPYRPATFRVMFEGNLVARCWFRATGDPDVGDNDYPTDPVIHLG